MKNEKSLKAANTTIRDFCCACYTYVLPPLSMYRIIAVFRYMNFYVSDFFVCRGRRPRRPAIVRYNSCTIFRKVFYTENILEFFL